MWVMSCCLNDAMLDMMEDFEFKENPINVGIISSQCHQYLRNVVDFHWPWTMTMNGSTPRSSRCVVLPILKLWPFIEPNPCADQISLQRDMNLVLHMAGKEQVDNSKVNRWAVGGTREFISMLLMKAHSALAASPESVHMMNSPQGFIFVEGAQKEWNGTFEAVFPDFWGWTGQGGWLGWRNN